MALWITALALSIAHAQGAPTPPVAADPPPRPDPMVVLRGIAETWSDPSIGSVYATGGLLSGAGVVVPFSRKLGLDVEVGYRRLHTDEGAETSDDTYLLEVLPISAVAEFSFLSANAPLDGFVGVGPSFAGFREHHPPDAAGLSLTRGAKFSLELRSGIRIDTGLIQPRMAPTSPVKGLDLELYGARRLQLPGGTGFDLDAWRGSVGLGVRL